MAGTESKKNRLAQAFQENGNLVGLAGAVGLSLALLNPLPLLVGLVAEAAYLLFVPDSKWYEARLGKRHEAEIVARREQLKRKILPTLAPPAQERFARLETVRAQIYAQAAEHEHEKWFDQVLRKIDYLLEKFLLFASKEIQFQTYLRSIQAEVRGGAANQRGGNNNGNNKQRGWWRQTPAGDYDLFDEDPKQQPRIVDRRGGGGKGRRIPVNVEPPPTPPRHAAPSWVHEAVAEIQAHYTRDIEGVDKLIEAEQDENTKGHLGKAQGRAGAPPRVH
jgi:hypothetical protein